LRRDPRSLLWDIAEAAAAIDGFTEGLDLERYTQSPLVHSAVERKFEIIGEALGQLAKLDPHLAARIPNAREIIAFRNLLIHGYAMVEQARVFRTARESLPALQEQVATLLAELNGRTVP
jgi:uncharacterized protein with HEPN domain